jgi:dTDP-4-dehydrorhamnose reductase
MSDRILVTGVSGFLGERIALRLLERRREASIVGVRFQRPIDVLGVEVISCDLADPIAVGRLIDEFRPTDVVHAAAQTDAAYCEREPDSARRAIVDATRNLVDSCRRIGVAELTLISTDLVFDGLRPPYRPDSHPNPLGVYGRLKVEAESIVANEASGRVLRTSLLFGRPGTHRSGFLGWMREAAAAGRPLTLFHDEYRTPIDADDLAEIVVRSLGSNLRGIWHAGGPERMSRVAMGEAMCRVFGYDRSIIQAKSLDEVRSKPPRPRDVTLDSSETYRALDFKPRDFEAALVAIRDD